MELSQRGGVSQPVSYSGKCYRVRSKLEPLFNEMLSLDGDEYEYGDWLLEYVQNSGNNYR
tara:strand:+ start:222 stop:401 length:180 start_codon:yes stop_codon:yes gene_type:complete